jgi:glutathione synthase/RimK-type ligase-like ATP-grasp enzyme
MSTTLVVLDNDLIIPQVSLNSISFEVYLHDYPKINEPKTRVINLCDTETYLSKGYYCSLLAEARNHQVLPSVKVINSLRNGRSIWLDGFDDLKEVDPDDVGQAQLVCMGEVADERYKKIANKVFSKIPAPLLKIVITPELSGIRVQVTRFGLPELDAEQLSFCQTVLQEYSRKSWRKPGAGKKFRWDIAILTDPGEAVPPSNKTAIARFVKAGEKLGMRVQPLSMGELHDLNQFDGLFIRETTAIDHYTYRLACRAEDQGLVVIDDPSSILRCCNKIYLHDAFNYQKVTSLKTVFVSDASESTLDQLENTFDYPLVLKLPEGSFSRGVYKTDNRSNLKRVLSDLLSESALVLAQEYLYTDYDWRVGVLNGRALYACRYYMARNHWQIYNHGSKRYFSGGFDTLPTFELPRHVLNSALKAASVVGDGLYGVDLKEVDGRAYVLEVNDNPSIDHGVEDRYLGEELYMQIMSEFLRRLESRGK